MYPVHELLRRSSADSPHKEAVVCGTTRLPFSAVSEAATSIASFLTSRGIGRGERVGIFTTKSVEEIFAIYGVLGSGAAFVHLNPQYRDTHLRHVITDCGIKTLFVDSARARMLGSAFDGESPLDLVISLSGGAPPDPTVATDVTQLRDILRSPRRLGDRPAEVQEDDVASIIYTSGSTGMPKGILVTHEIFYDSTVASAEVLNNTREDRIISITPFSFDGALSQLFTAMYVGGTLVQQRSNFAKDIVDTLLDEKITGCHAVPSLWGILLQERSPFPRHSYPYLRYVSIIGEVLPARHLARLREILGATDFYLMYGTTEAFRSTYLPPPDLDRKPGSVGIPFPGVSVAVLDDNGDPCPAGEIGMIVHRGAFVSPGYWKDPERTGRTFVDGSVHTGDRGWLDDEGYLYYAGRCDSMIKVQGFRLSPEEVEVCIHDMESVAEVAVIGVPAKEIGTIVKALIVLHPSAQTSDKDVINHCRTQLPHYMIPSVVEFLPALPKTSGNKLNRAALV
ncbi:MAG: AMP-binding protein [Gemmatimonadota bacterium]|nr:MAG: AMP-binding protein [Gemmatimonadota bacterium]